MPLFDAHCVVDWSASSSPKAGRDSIWIAWRDKSGLTLDNPKTRSEAVALLSERLAKSDDKRVLLGFDFAFGYPVGSLAHFDLESWKMLWGKLRAHLQDADDNANNRFDVASQLNKVEGPFWGYPHQHHGRYGALPFKKPKGYGESLPPNKRYTDAQIKGTQEVWKLTGAGSVGSQALTGIARLEALRQKHDVSIWPFEEPQHHVAVEVFPSMVAPDPREDIRDAGQVRSLSRAFAKLDAADQLQPLFDTPNDAAESVRHEEGLIFGQGFETQLQEAARIKEDAHAPL